MVTDLLNNPKYDCEGIYCTQEWYINHIKMLETSRGLVHIVTLNEMSEFTLLNTASPVYILLKKIEEELNYSLIINSYSVLLDGVQDPGNVGTIIRMADWFGIQTVIRTPSSSDFYNPKCVQASMGSFCNVSLVTATLGEIVLHVPELPVLAMDMSGQNINDVVLPDNGIIVLGSEGQGISDEIDQFICTKVGIPGKANRFADSLNVAVSAGIILNKLFSRK